MLSRLLSRASLQQRAFSGMLRREGVSCHARLSPFNFHFEFFIADSLARVALSSAAPANAVLLERAAVQSRLTAVLQSQPFVDASKLSPSASFYHDLGLDELHAVHIAAAVHGEFCVEVPAV